MTAPSPVFTTADAERLLSYGDVFLSEAHEAARKNGDTDNMAVCDQQTAEWDAIRPLFVQAPALLGAVKDLLGDSPQVQGGICQHCGRDYIGDMLEGDCSAEDCPAHIASVAIAQAEGRTHTPNGEVAA